MQNIAQFGKVGYTHHIMVVRMRHTRAHTRNRRSHHALVAPRISKCKDCGAAYLRHVVCANCGKYKGRVVLDVMAKSVKAEKKAKATAQK